jgi:spore germination cell wall hydrolase CwlJ-like protein
MPEEPFLYYEEDESGDPRYPDMQLTYEERQLLARVIWAEARGECAEGQQAVAEVVLNRMASEKFGNTLNDVIYAEGQFRSVPYLDDAEPYQAQYDAIERAIYGPYILPEDVVHFATFRTNNNVWGQIGGHIFCYEY